MPTDFPLLRQSLAPEFADLPAEHLDALVQRIYGPEANAEDVEGFFDDIGKGLSSVGNAVGHFAQQAAPMVGKALPGIAQGAAAGSALGPWGALAGALAGGAGSILSQTNNPTARAIGSGLTGVTNLVSTVRGGGAGGAMGALSSLAGSRGAPAANAAPLSVLSGGGGGSANALLGLLARPEIMQALTSAAMGSFGRQSVPVGGQAVPVNTLLSALGTLAGRSAHEAAEFDGSAEQVPAFFSEASEALGLDVDDAEGRTDTLLTLLALSPMIWGSQAPKPVTVNVAAPTDPVPPPSPPVTVAENVWITESAEDYPELSDWESAYEIADEGIAHV